MSKNKLFVLDTNVLVSAILFKFSLPYHALKKIISVGLIAVSQEVAKEHLEVIERPKFNKYISSSDRIKVFKKVMNFSKEYEVTEKITVCRDPKDNVFLSLAKSAQADYIISGDADLLILHPFQGIPILKPTDFLDIQNI